MEPKTELQKNAIATARRRELEIDQRALDMQWLNGRMETGRMSRSLAVVQREADLEKEFQERTDHAAIVNARAARETSLGIEVAKVRREEVCQLLRRHYLREHDHSLRELIKKLQYGYVCRDLQLQIKNNEYRKLQEKAEEKYASSVLLGSLYNNQEAQESEDKLKMEQNIQYRKDLQQQLVNREQQRRCTYEDTLIEKKMLEDIMRTLADEDQRELAQKRETTKRLRTEMVAFQQARDAWKQKQKQIVVKEEREIEKQNEAMADRSAAIIAERERKRLEKEALNDKICAKILADEAERNERENIIKSLQEQEYLEKNANDDIGGKEKLERSKTDAKDALTAQMENRKKLDAEAKEQEAKFRKETEAKIEADNKKEREKEIERRRKGKQYSEDLLQQIQSNKEKKQKEKELNDWRAKQVWDHHKAWAEEVSNERKTIIREHAPPLLGYLQAGVLTKSDLPTVIEGASADPELKKLDIGAMATTKQPRRFSKCNAQCRVLREY